MSRFHRSKPRLASLVVAAVTVAAGLSAGVTGAAAAEHDPLAVLQRLAPELLDQTVLPASPAESAAIEAATGATPFAARIPDDASAPIRLAPAETEGAGLPVAITIDDARGRGETVQGLHRFATADPAATALVQPLADGIRLLTTLADATAGDAFSYTFDLPEGSTRTVLPDGQTLVSDAQHHYIGTVGAPWARDAAGRSLETAYSWAGDTLTQHVVLTEETAFPVVMDPLWLYSYDFSATLPLYHAAHPKASERSVDRLLHGCFNCYFPINGGPRSYPADGQILDLNASPFSLITVPAPVKVQTANGGALQFVAQAGHFDGAGSIVTFSWYNDPSGYLHLYVHAMIMVDRGAAANIANSRIAGANWLLYWQRVADNADGSSGGGGV